MRVRAVTSLLISSVTFCNAFDDVYYYQSIASDHVIKESIYKGWMIKLGYWEGFPKEVREKLQEWGTVGKKVGSLFAIKPVAMKYDSPQSVAEIKPFIQEFNINRSEILKTIESFKSFNEFFYRQLKPGARIVDARPGILVAPADSKLRILSGGIPGNSTKFYIKQQEFDLDSFLGLKAPNEKYITDPQKAANADLVIPYNNGLGYSDLWDLMVFRLAPTDYHRVHFPCDGRVTRIIDVKKDTTYGSVSPIAYRAGRWPICENYRIILKIETDKFGTMLMVIVGAAGTNTIKLTFGTEEQRKNLRNARDLEERGIDASLSCYKGQETGYFAFGGSTICLLFKKNFVIFPKILVQRSLFQDKRDEKKEPYETAVKVGQGVGVWANEAPDGQAVAEHLATQNYLDQLDPLFNLIRTPNKKSYFYVTDVSVPAAQSRPTL